MALLPAAAELSFSKLLSELTSCVGRKQLTRIEPMVSDSSVEDDRQLAEKLGTLRAAKSPKTESVRRTLQRDDLFDAAVAVSGDDENRAREERSGWDAKDDVVMKLALLPMVHELVGTEDVDQQVEEGAQHHGVGETLQQRVHGKQYIRLGIGAPSRFGG